MIKKVTIIMPNDKRLDITKFEEAEWSFYCSVKKGDGISINGKRYAVSDTEHTMDIPTGLLKSFSKVDMSMIIKLSD
jgi:hypothetical protein